MLILAGITITQLTGSGLFGNAKIAKERTRYGTAKEIVELKLMEIETECIKKDEDYTLAKVADGMKNAKDITTQNYYYKKTSKEKDGLNREPGELEGVAVSVDEYKEYIFLIGKRSEDGRIGIIGAVKGEKSDIGDTSKFEPIDEFEKKILGGTTGGNEPGDEGDTEKEPEDIDVNVPGLSDDIDLSNPIEITTYMAVKSNTNNNLKVTGVEEINYTVESITSNVSFLNGILSVNKNADSTDICTITITGKYQNQSYTNHLTIYVEPKYTSTIDGNDYYKIYTRQDLVRLGELTNHNIGSIKNAIMMNDIDLKGIEWEPIGYWKNENDYIGFKGIFDGQNYKIQNMKINRLQEETNKTGVAFIGVLDGGTIKNIKFENVNIYSEIQTTGICVGDSLNDSIIENIKVLNGKIESTNDNVGGICGYSEKYYGENGSIIKNCSNNAVITVTGNNIHIGGISGANVDSSIENCYNTGTITVENCSCIGGISGKNTISAKISSCYNLGDITKNNNFSQDNARVGGIVGVNYDNSKIEYCYNLGNVLNNSTDKNVGGIVGISNSNGDSVNSCLIRMCYNKCNVTSDGSNMGGIIGYNTQYGKVKNCYISNSIEVKFGTTLISTKWGSANNNYLGRLIGHVDNQDYGENVANLNDEDMPTVYDVLNEFGDDASMVWSNDNLNQPHLIWENNN